MQLPSSEGSKGDELDNDADDPGDHLPGGMVFTCLSHDVVAHETTHALLDGMHTRFIRASNPDVLAFHEAFADIVALLQHFTIPEILYHQMALTRGQIRVNPNLLGELAGEFGRTTGLRDALRSAIGSRDPKTGEWRPHRPDPTEYRTLSEPHERGAILVAAIFDAFLSIYESRIADLLRLATGGSGLLPAGAISPDLVHRLSEAATTSALHVLTMCVRALDYCPPVDLNFSEYLRAIITADYDFMPDDDRNYRTAFIQAFRLRGIYPPEVRTLSAETLRWTGWMEDENQPSVRLLEGIREFRERLPHQIDGGSREQIFQATRDMRKILHGWLIEHFANGAHPEDAFFLGIDPTRRFEVHFLRVANRVRPDGNLLRQLMIGILQEAVVPLDPADPAGPTMVVEGGCTIIANLQTLTIDYCIRKNAKNIRGAPGPHSTYFGDAASDSEPVARLHRGL